MSLGMIIRSVLEFAVIVFTIWAVFHEDRFAAFERRILAQLRRRRFRVISSEAAVQNCRKATRRV